MLKYKRLVFNALQVNCWVVYADDGACIVFDPGCSNPIERQELDQFIKDSELSVKAVIVTHGHFDHVPGVSFVRNSYSVPFMGHRDEQELIEFAAIQAKPFGFDFESAVPAFDRMLEPGKKLIMGSIELEVFHVPGHSAGSMAFYSKEGGFVIVGDVLFKGSIGRTDLPGGNYQTLMDSINRILLPLPPDTRILSGHGPESTIGEEISSNPFLS